jgi:hypothetical protein
MKLINQQKGNHFLLIDLIFSVILIAVMIYIALEPNL